jgi:MoaA/NifB/PqqE/SkfB family radical SAM enzyme
MPLDRFADVLRQIPEAGRLVLHGLGEPLLHESIDRMVGLGKSQGRCVLFNTNGFLLDRPHARRLIASGLDELRVSVDMPDPALYGQVRRGGLLETVYANIAAFQEEKDAAGATRPVVSLWMTEGVGRLPHLPRLVKDAAGLGVREVYLQRLILMDRGEAKEENAVFGRLTPELRRCLEEAERVARESGVTLWGSGNTNPAFRDEAGRGHPWQACRRPFEATYVTVNGNVLPCCLSPFTAAAHLEQCLLGNVFERPFEQLWDGGEYGRFRAAFMSDQAPVCCARCGTDWSL